MFIFPEGFEHIQCPKTVILAVICAITKKQCFLYILKHSLKDSPRKDESEYVYYIQLLLYISKPLINSKDIKNNQNTTCKFNEAIRTKVEASE